MFPLTAEYKISLLHSLHQVAKEKKTAQKRDLVLSPQTE